MSTSTVSGSDPSDRKRIRDIAWRQRIILYCILIQVILYAATFMVPPEFQPLLAIPLLLTILVAAFELCFLAMGLYGVATGILATLLTLIPLIGLIVLLIVNGKATSILRENGIEVGLLGAKGKIE